MIKDIFSHVNVDSSIPVQLLDKSGNPVSMSSSIVSFATSLDFGTTVIETLTSANSSQIEVTDSNSAIINVLLNTNSDKGYKSGTYRYQLKVYSEIDETSQIYLEGRLFLEPSLF